MFLALTCGLKVDSTFSTVSGPPSGMRPSVVNMGSEDLMAATYMALGPSSAPAAVSPSWFSAQNFNANIRKWAHVYIYCALGVSMAVTVHLWTRRIALWQQGLLAAALCTLYAMSDEIHQYFVPARAMLLTDVGIDAFGFLPCIAVTCIIIWLLQRRKAKQ